MFTYPPEIAEKEKQLKEITEQRINEHTKLSNEIILIKSRILVKRFFRWQPTTQGGPTYYHITSTYGSYLKCNKISFYPDEIKIYEQTQEMVEFFSGNKDCVEVTKEEYEEEIKKLFAKLERM